MFCICVNVSPIFNRTNFRLLGKQQDKNNIQIHYKGKLEVIFMNLMLHFFLLELYKMN